MFPPSGPKRLLIDTKDVKNALGTGNPTRLVYHTMEIFYERLTVPGELSINMNHFSEPGNQSTLQSSRQLPGESQLFSKGNLVQSMFSNPNRVSEPEQLTITGTGTLLAIFSRQPANCAGYLHIQATFKAGCMCIVPFTFKTLLLLLILDSPLIATENHVQPIIVLSVLIIE